MFKLKYAGAYVRGLCCRELRSEKAYVSGLMAEWLGGFCSRGFGPGCICQRVMTGGFMSAALFKQRSVRGVLCQGAYDRRLMCGGLLR